MTDTALIAQGKSPFVQEATEEKKVVLPSYKIPYGTGQSIPTFDRIPSSPSYSVNTLLTGKTVTATINANGKWKLALVRIAFRFGGTLDGTANIGPIGLTMCDHIVSTYGNTLRTQKAETTMAHLNKLSPSMKNAIMQRAFVLDANTEQPITGIPAVDTDYVTYGVLFLASFESIRNNWPVDTLEPIQVKSTFNAVKRVGLIATASIKASSNAYAMELFQINVDRPADEKMKLYNDNFGSGSDLAFMSYDSDVQVHAFTSNANASTAGQSVKFKVSTVVPATSSDISCRPAVPTVDKAGVNVPFTRADVYLNNKPFVYDIPAKVTSFIADMSGASAGMSVKEDGVQLLDTYRIHTFAWNERPMDRTSFTGCLSFGTPINLPEFEVFFAPGQLTDSTAYEITSNHDYPCELMFNGKSGRIARGVAS